MKILAPLAMDSAPEGAQSTLKEMHRVAGFVPNLYAVVSRSAVALDAYTKLSSIFQGSSLSAIEQQIVLMETSAENGCDYCMAAHSAGAAMQRIDPEMVSAIRARRPISDPKYAALQIFVRRVVEQRGRLEAADVRSLLDVGYTEAQLLEVLVGVGLKTISNYVNHLAETPLDPQFEPYAWPE